MCGFVVGHSVSHCPPHPILTTNPYPACPAPTKEDGSKPDLEGYDRYVIIDLDADGSDPDGMIYRSSGLLEMPLSLTDPLLCAAHAAKTLNQCLNTMVCCHVHYMIIIASDYVRVHSTELIPNLAANQLKLSTLPSLKNQTNNYASAGLSSQDPTDVVDMLPAWRAAIFRLRLAAVGVVNSVLWRLPYFCRPERGLPKRFCSGGNQ